MKARALRSFALPGLVLGLALAGCAQVETRVKLNPDMTATITERVRFTKRLLDLAGAEGRADLLKLLSKDAAQRRMKKMGRGVKLVSHRLREAEGASRESLTVFKVQRLDDFQYVSPWLAYGTYPQNNVIKCKVEPILKNRDPYNERPGDMAVSFLHVKRPPRVTHIRELTEKPEKVIPRNVQVFRELGPVFRDMLKGLKLRLTFESYAPVKSRLGVRNQRAGATEVDLLNFSDKNLDSWGGLFLKNEELMLDLLRWDLASADVHKHVAGFVGNHTLPVYHRRGGHGTRICFRPSRPFFDKYLAGKTITSPWWRGRSEKADFARIGWRPGKKPRTEEKDGGGGGKAPPTQPPRKKKGGKK